MDRFEKDELNRRRRANLLLGGRREIRTDRDAARWIDDRGFAPLAPIDGCSLPSMSDADANGGTWEVTDGSWRWKETLPAAKACVYTKFFRGGGTFISWDHLPHFLSLYASRGTPDEDYQGGLLSRMEKRILDLVAEAGPLDSHELWRCLRPDFPGPRNRMIAALTHLQRTFRLTVCGGSLEGWSMHEWDLLARQAPEGVLDSPPLPDESREKLLLKYVANAVACPADEPARLFHWDRLRTRAVIENLVARRRLRDDRRVAGLDGPTLTLPD